MLPESLTLLNGLSWLGVYLSRGLLAPKLTVDFPQHIRILGIFLDKRRRDSGINHCLGFNFFYGWRYQQRDVDFQDIMYVYNALIVLLVRCY